MNILIIDDDKLLCDMYGKKFRDRGAEVDIARSAVEALEKLRAGGTYDLIVFDIVMPGLDGFGFLEALGKERLAEGAVKVALTNQSLDEDRERAKSLGADGYIVKANTVPSGAVEEALRIASEKKKH